MAALLLCAAIALAGGWGLLLAATSLASMLLLGPRAAPETVMRSYAAEPIVAAHGRTLLAMVAELAVRAGLGQPPVIHVIPSPTLNAFAVGTAANSAIALTEGLVRRLDMRELAGVLAHEISHIRNGDLWIMGLADGVTRMARILSLSALALMALNLVSLVTGEPGMSWLGLLLLYLTPFGSSLLQQALSRTREFDADLDGVTLTGDATGLVSALAKIDPDRNRPWEDLVFGMRRVAQPSLLRSHPTTDERLTRLREVAAARSEAPPVPRPWPPLVVVDGPLITSGRAGTGPNTQRPRTRWWAGVWY